MLMFTFHLVMLLALVVFGAGTVLLHIAGRNGGSTPLRVGGLVVAIGGAVSALCIAYYGVKYWRQGAYETAHPMMNQMMKMHGMMRPGMMGPTPGQAPDDTADKDEHGH